MGETQLAHKILAISEEEGAEQATYALKILQSEKRLRIASTGKDPKTGRLVTQEYVVEGPCVIFMTTTTIEIDEELQNRCILLTVNEDRDQTRRIHELQRQSRTLDGLLLKEKKNQVLHTHRNAQRLLKPVLVANPYAEKLTFLDSRLRTRRDHIKYLNLINAITLLYQYQRPMKTVNHNGKSLSYIEVTTEDIEAANQLAAEVMGISLDDIAPQTRKLLLMIHDVAVKKCDELQIELQDLRLTRREIREATGWGNTQLGIHLSRLVDHEYLISHRDRGRQQLYELLYRGEGRNGGRFLLNLIDLDHINGKYDATCTGVNSVKPPQIRGESGVTTVNLQSEESTATSSESGNNNTDPPNYTENHVSGTEKPSSSYPQIRQPQLQAS